MNVGEWILIDDLKKKTKVLEEDIESVLAQLIFAENIKSITN